jgi:hypothetical protein
VTIDLPLPQSLLIRLPDGALEPIPRYRVRVKGAPAATGTGYGWWYELLDMSRPEGSRIVVLATRWTWRQAVRDGIADLCARAEWA